MDRKKQITRQQYLDALELIDMYHRQSSDRDVEDYGKTKMIDWLNNLDQKPSTWLFNVLVTNFEYFEDVNRYTFSRCRNVGVKGWEEFCSLANIKP